MELRWTAPSRTTDGLDLTSSNVLTSVDVCRDPLYAFTAAPVTPGASRVNGGNGTEPHCTVVLHLPGHAGTSAATDRLPAGPGGSGAAGAALAYRVRVLNANGRAAPASAAALVPGGPTLAPVDGFRAIPQKTGVLLSWQPAAGPPGELVEVSRTLQPPAPGEATGSRPQKSPSRSVGTPSIHAHQEARTDTVRLRPAADAPAARPAGMVDKDALADRSYTYAAERVRTVSVAGLALEQRGEPTTPVTVVLRDTFPPEPPRGLASIPGSIPSPSAGDTPRPTIDLSWEANAENDLAGYNVYRTIAGSGDPERKLNGLPLPGPAYRDAMVDPGNHYVYRVTAVDQRGNESRPSAPVTDSSDGR